MIDCSEPFHSAQPHVMFSNQRIWNSLVLLPTSWQPLWSGSDLSCSYVRASRYIAVQSSPAASQAGRPIWSRVNAFGPRRGSKCSASTFQMVVESWAGMTTSIGGPCILTTGTRWPSFIAAARMAGRRPVSNRVTCTRRRARRHSWSPLRSDHQRREPRTSPSPLRDRPSPDFGLAGSRLALYRLPLTTGRLRRYRPMPA